METLNYPALAITLIGFTKLLVIFLLVFILQLLIYRGLGTFSKLTISLKDEDKKDRIGNKSWNIGLIIMIVSLLIVEIFTSPYAMVYADSLVVNALMTCTQAMSVMIIFGLLSIASSLMYTSYHYRLINNKKKSDKPVFKVISYILLGLSYLALVLTFLPILFYIIEVYIR